MNIKIPWKIISLILSWKFCVIALTLFASSILPFNSAVFKGNFSYPKDQKITISTSLKTWDAQHYLYLADAGYKPDQASNWFYPLYPLTIKIMNFITHKSFISALLISNVFSFFGLLFFYFFVRSKFNENIAYYSLILFIAFPTAFYLNLIYSEGLFFFLLAGFFLSLFKKKYLLVALFSCLLPFTRSVGIFIIIPLLISLIVNKGKGIQIRIPTFNVPIRFKFYPVYILLLFPFFGFAINLIYIYFGTGNAFSEFTAQKYFIGGYFVSNLFSPNVFFSNLFTTKFSLHGLTNSILDRTFFVLFLSLLPLIYRKFGKPMFYFYLAIILVPLLGSFMGYMRYLIPAFIPLSIALALLFDRRKYLFFPILLILLMLQSFFIILQALNYWVS